MGKSNKRILVGLDAEMEDRLRLLAFQTKTPLVDIIRQCIDRAIDDVERHLTQKPDLRPVNQDDVRRLRRMMSGAAPKAEEPR